MNHAAGLPPSEQVNPDETNSTWIERFVLIYRSAPGARSKVPKLFPAHSAYADDFRVRHPGALLMIGPFPEPEEGQPGAMSIWTSREAAEEFAPSDPFRRQRDR